MTAADPVHAWLNAAIADAERRGLPELKPLLQGLAVSTDQLRRADWNDEASGGAATVEPADRGRAGGGDRC